MPIELDIDFDDPPAPRAELPESFENARPVKVTREEGRNGQRPSGVARELPHSLEAEEMLLSCCLIDGADVVARCLEASIRPASFYDTKHRTIYDRLLDLYQRQIPIDISVVAEELKTARQLEQVGGFAFLMQISQRVPTTAQASYFIEKVREQSLLRELIRSATGIVEDCYSFSGGIQDFTTDIMSRFEGVTAGASSSTLESRKFNPAEKPTEERVILSLTGKPICTAGNITNIVAQSGVGKSAVVGAIIAATQVTGTDDVDCLGFSGPNYGKLPLLHFDTEQSKSHYQRNNFRALKRTGRTEFPPWFHSYHLTGLSAPEARHAVENTIAKHARKAGGVFAVLIDGWADLVVSPNDEKECFPFVIRMQDLAIRHDTAIVGVLHLNPVAKAGDPSKGRGHLGSHLIRKAETVLELEMDADQVTRMYSTKKRGAPITKARAPAFKWSDDHQMHRTCASGEALGEGKGRTKKYTFDQFATIFPREKEKALPRQALYRFASELAGIKETAFRDILHDAVEGGLLARIPLRGGGYTYYVP